MDGLLSNTNDLKDLIKDATSETFMTDVIEASRSVPVLVDFWATWCGPCRTLGPTLEKVVTATKGKVKLVKVDVDQNQLIAGQLGVQSIPMVFVFWQGRPVDYFTGALPERQLQEFINRIIAQTGGMADGVDQDVEHILGLATQTLAEGNAQQAAQLYSQILQEDTQNLKALAGLAKCHINLGDFDQAHQVLALTPPDKKEDADIRSAHAQLALAESAGGNGDIAALNQRIEADPQDLEARFERASLESASGDYEAAIDDLLTIIRADKQWGEGKARDQLLKLFDALGFDDPRAKAGRRRLSSLLFA